MGFLNCSRHKRFSAKCPDCLGCLEYWSSDEYEARLRRGEPVFINELDIPDVFFSPAMVIRKYHSGIAW